MESTKKGATAVGSYCAEMWEDAKAAGAHALKAAPYAAIIVAAPIILASKDVKAEVVPSDFRVDPNYLNLSQLINYNAVQQIGYSARPGGFIKFEDGTLVPPTWRLWVLDNGTKPSGWDPGTIFFEGLQSVGVIDVVTSGLYSFNTTSAIRGDKYEQTPTVDEGATVGTPVKLVCQDLTTDKFFSAEFTFGTMMTYGFQPGANTQHNVMVDRTKEYSHVCGDWLHPYPVGDIDHNCDVGMSDLIVLSENWLADCTLDGCGGSDLYMDDGLHTVNLEDFRVLSQHWKECTSPN